jgi:uncharacterized protein YoxC
MDSSEFLKMDLFFVVTTTVVAIGGLVLTVLGFYLVRVVRDISEITRTMKEQTKGISRDLDAVRSEIKDGVHEVRTNVSESLASAKTFTKAIAGAGIVRAVSHVMQAIVEDKITGAATSRTKRTSRKKTKGEG